MGHWNHCLHLAVSNHHCHQYLLEHSENLFSSAVNLVFESNLESFGDFFFIWWISMLLPFAWWKKTRRFWAILVFAHAPSVFDMAKIQVYYICIFIVPICIFITCSHLEAQINDDVLEIRFYLLRSIYEDLGIASQLWNKWFDGLRPYFQYQIEHRISV